jgi:hypothetical protein
VVIREGRTDLALEIYITLYSSGLIQHWSHKSPQNLEIDLHCFSRGMAYAAITCALTEVFLDIDIFIFCLCIYMYHRFIYIDLIILKPFSNFLCIPTYFHMFFKHLTDNLPYFALFSIHYIMQHYE